MFPCLYFHSSGLILFIPTVLIFLLGFGSFSNRFLRKVEKDFIGRPGALPAVGLPLYKLCLWWLTGGKGREGLLEDLVTWKLPLAYSKGSHQHRPVSPTHSFLRDRS